MKMEGQTQNPIRPMEGAALPRPLGPADVEERLVEAMITCWRHPDRERGWQRVRSTWPEALYEAHEHGDGGVEGEVALRTASATRADVAEMDEAFSWAGALKPMDRKLVGIVVSQLARGRREVSWRALLRPMGLTRGADGLRMRYGRALGAMAARANGGNARGCAVNRDDLRSGE